MNAVKYLKEKYRMVKKYCDSDECSSCPFHFDEGFCTEYEANYPEKAVEIVEKWASEQLRKTRQSEFLKMFPNASQDKNGLLFIPPCNIDDTYICSYSCDECRKEYWREEIKDDM